MESAEKFLEIAYGVSRRNKIIPASDISKAIAVAQRDELELYRSYWTYDAGIKDHVAQHHSVRGYRGIYSFDTIVFDIDRKDGTLQQAIERTRAFCEKLKDDWIGEEYIKVFFSGRGFHVTVPDMFGFTPGPSLPETVKATLTTYFEEADPIWYDTSLIRVAGTINKKSEKYKIRITLAELFNCGADEVELMACAPRVLPADENEPYTVQHANKIIPAATAGSTPVARTERRTTDASTIISCVQHMLNQEPQEGQRHENGLRIATAYKRAGVTKEGVTAILKDWAPTMTPREFERITEWAFSANHGFKCSDPVMTKYCDPKCIFYKKKNYQMDVKSAADMEREFCQFIRSDYSERSFDLGEVYSLPQPYLVLPGELVVVTGDTKLGKTAWVQGLVTDLTRLRTTIVNNEITQWLYYRRLVQHAHHMTKDEVVRHYRLQTNSLSSRLSHLTCLTMSTTLSGLRRLVVDTSPHILVIDTTEGIAVDGADENYARERGLFLGLRDMARDMGVIIIAVHHVRKGGVGNGLRDTTTLNLNSPKGASAVVQQADKIIGIEGEQHSSRRVVKSLAARDEGEMELALNFDYDHMTFNQI